MCLRPVPRPRPDRTPLAQTECRYCPRPDNNEGSREDLFRGSITRAWHWLSTLRRGHCWPPRKTRFRLLARLYRVGLATHRVPTKGLMLSEQHSAFPKLRLAQCQFMFSLAWAETRSDTDFLGLATRSDPALLLVVGRSVLADACRLQNPQFAADQLVLASRQERFEHAREQLA